MPPSPSPQNSNPRPAWLRALPWLLLAFSSFGAFWLRGVHYPGWASLDEEANLRMIQWWREGLGSEWRLGAGCLYRALLMAWASAFGFRLEVLQLLSLAILWAEALLLHAWLRRQFQAAAADWSVALLAISSLSLIRSSSLLSFHLMPLELLLLLIWLPRARSASLSAALWGACSALLMLDFEGWISGQALLGLCWLSAKPSKSKSAWALAGWLAASAALLPLSSAHLRSWLMVRQSQTMGGSLADIAAWSFQYFRGFFIGGTDCLLYLGVPGAASFAWLGGLGLALAAVFKRGRAWLWAGAAIGLAPLLLHGTGLEAGRTMAAWPFLLALAGAGLAWAETQARPAALLLALLAAATAWQSQQSYAQALATGWGRFYAQSAGQLQAAVALKELGGPRELLSDLGPDSGAPFRMLCGAPSSGGVDAALIPTAFAPKQPASMGRWMAFEGQPGEEPVLLLLPNPAALARLRAVNSWMAGFWKAQHLRPSDQVYQALVEALKAGPKDIWLRSALWEARLNLSLTLGIRTRDELAEAAKAELLEVDPQFRLARSLASDDPRAALSLLEKAAQRDPRRREIWELRLRLLQKLGREQEAARLLRQFQALPQGATYLPFWKYS